MIKILILLFLFCPVFAQQQTRASHEDVVGCWHFNEGTGSVAFDSSLYQSHGVITQAAWTDGKFSRGLSFDGASDVVDCATLDEIAHSSGAVSVWTYVTGPQGAGYKGLVTRVGMYSIFTNGNLLGWYDWGGTGANFGTTSPNVNKWNFFVLNWANAIPNGTELYLNGVLIHTGEVNIVNALNEQAIGSGDAPANGQDWLGIIDDVTIYSRNLSDSEMKNLYREGRLIHGN